MERCGTCSKEGARHALRRCSRCKVVRYCSTQCQSLDWPRHKATCRESSVDGPTSAGAEGQPSSSTTTNTPAKPPHTSPPSQPLANPFASLFDGTFYQSPWQRARSRAREAFPDCAEVTDDLSGDLELTEQEVEVEHREVVLPFSGLMGAPFLPFPFPFPHAVPLPPRVVQIRATCGKILVLRLVGRSFAPLPPNAQAWETEDSKGKKMIVFLEIDSPAPYFRFHDLRTDNFLCVKEAEMILMAQEFVCFMVLKDASLVRVFRP